MSWRLIWALRVTVDGPGDHSWIPKSHYVHGKRLAMLRVYGRSLRAILNPSNYSGECIEILRCIGILWFDRFIEQIKCFYTFIYLEEALGYTPCMYWIILHRIESHLKYREVFLTVDCANSCMLLKNELSGIWKDKSIGYRHVYLRILVMNMWLGFTEAFFPTIGCRLVFLPGCLARGIGVGMVRTSREGMLTACFINAYGAKQGWGFLVCMKMILELKYGMCNDYHLLRVEVRKIKL